MRIILVIIALFCCTRLCAQLTTPPENHSAGRELPRGVIVSYPSATEAQTAARASKYLTPLEQWGGAGESLRIDFTSPFAWANRQVLLHLPAVTMAYTVWVNGIEVGRAANPNLAAEFNITKQTHEGRNTLELHFAVMAASLESYKTMTVAPSLRGAYLLSQPTMHVRDVLVRTWDPKNDMKAEIGVVVASNALNPKTSRVYYELLSPTGDIVVSSHKDLTLDMRREDTLRFVVAVPLPLRWSSEYPARCMLRLKVQYEGRYLEYLELPIGFRTLEFAEGKVAVNGIPTELHAQQVSPEITIPQIQRLREDGYNTLRLMPGLVPDSLYTFCDQIGMYVIAQAPINSSNSGQGIRKGGNPSNDPAWQSAYLERTTDSFHTAKGHPSVIAFSLAEKSANGICLYESYLLLKEMGDERPILYFDAKGEWNSDKLEYSTHPGSGM